MDELKLQKRYAQSLFDLAKQENIIEEIFSDVELIYDVCKHNREFCVILKNPTIKPLKKREILFALFNDKCNALTMKFLSLIASKHREIYLQGICSSFVEIYNKHNGIKIAKLFVAQKASEEIKQAIKQRLEADFSCKVQIEEHEDRNLIGGFIIEFDDKQYDASFVRKLNDLKREITK